MSLQKLTGKIIFPEDVSSIKSCNLQVSVEDVSRADASSETKAKKVFENLDLSSIIDNSYEFSLDVPVDDQKATLTVRVHVDVDKDDEVSIGDFLTTALFLVLTQGNPDYKEVKVQKIQ